MEFAKVNYYEQPLTAAKLRELLDKAGLAPRDIMRSGEKIYRELGLSDKSLSDDALIAAMVTHPDLIQRPIVERGPRAVLGRPKEKINKVLQA